MFGVLRCRSVTLLVLLSLWGAEASAVSLRPHNETLPLSPFRPGLNAPWCGAARPGDQVYLAQETLPEDREGLLVVLSGDRQRRSLTPEEASDGVRFPWPDAFSSGERVVVLMERTKTWEDLYRQGRRWLRTHTSGSGSSDQEEASAMPPLPEAAEMVTLQEDDPVLQRVTADPASKLLLLRGRNLRGALTAHYPDGSAHFLTNDANATLRLPYEPGKEPGLLTVERHDGRRSNPLLVRFPRKVTGLLVLPEGSSLDLDRVEIFDPSRLDQETPAEDAPPRSDGSFTAGVEAGEGRRLGIFFRSQEGSPRTLLVSVDVPPGEDSVLVVLAPEDLEPAALSGDLGPKKDKNP